MDDDEFAEFIEMGATNSPFGSAWAQWSAAQDDVSEFLRKVDARYLPFTLPSQDGVYDVTSLSRK